MPLLRRTSSAPRSARGLRHRLTWLTGYLQYFIQQGTGNSTGGALSCTQVLPWGHSALVAHTSSPAQPTKQAAYGEEQGRRLLQVQQHALLAGHTVESVQATESPELQELFGAQKEESKLKGTKQQCWVL
jgi:hypothetical protein